MTLTKDHDIFKYLVKTKPKNVRFNARNDISDLLKETHNFTDMNHDLHGN